MFFAHNPMGAQQSWASSEHKEALGRANALKALHGVQEAIEKADGLLKLLETNEQHNQLTGIINLELDRQLVAMQQRLLVLAVQAFAVRSNRKGGTAKQQSFDEELQGLDENNDGELSYDELYQLFEQKRLAKMETRKDYVRAQFADYDLNRDGGVASSEYTQHYYKHVKAMGATAVDFQTLLSYFSFADKNRSNELDVEEFAGLYHLFGLDGSAASEEYKLMIAEQHIVDAYGESFFDGDGGDQESDYSAISFSAYSKNFGADENEYHAADANEDGRLDAKELSSILFPSLHQAVTDVLFTLAIPAVTAAVGGGQRRERKLKYQRKTARLVAQAKNMSVGIEQCRLRQDYILRVLHSRQSPADSTTNTAASRAKEEALWTKYYAALVET
jgi:Ca2+-binding EF-hand superfamily protein